MNLTQQELIEGLCDGLVFEGLRPSVRLVKTRWQIGKRPGEAAIRAGVQRWYDCLYGRLIRQPEGSHLPDWLVIRLSRLYNEMLQEIKGVVPALKDEDIEELETVFARYWLKNYPNYDVDTVKLMQRRTKTFDDAYNCCEKLLKQGERPSAGAVSAMLGRGSMTVVQHAVQVWWSDLANKLYRVKLTDYPMPVALYRVAMEMVDHFAPEAEKRASEKNQAKLDELARERDAAKNTIESLERKIKIQEDQLIDVEQSLQSAEKQIVAEKSRTLLAKKEGQAQIKELRSRLSSCLIQLRESKNRERSHRQYAESHEKYLMKQIDKARNSRK